MENETGFPIEKLWEAQGKMEESENGCFSYGDLKSNYDYLQNYGRQYYEQARKTFEAFKKVVGDKRVSLSSFGCGPCLDYLAAREYLGENFQYHAINECEWPIKKTAAYKSFVPAMPKGNSKYDGGLFLLTATPDNTAVCFFNSLNDIIANKNVKEDLIPILL